MIRPLAFLAIFISPAAFAVTVANCPEKLKVSFDDVRTLSDAELQRNIDSEDIFWELAELQPTRDAMAAKPASFYSKLEFKRTSTEHSVCGYTLKGHPTATGSDETRLFTRGGRDILRVAIPLKDRLNVWVYYTVESYGEEGLKVRSSTASRFVGFEDHGDMKMTMGWGKTRELR